MDPIGFQFGVILWEIYQFVYFIFKLVLIITFNLNLR